MAFTRLCRFATLVIALNRQSFLWPRSILFILVVLLHWFAHCYSKAGHSKFLELSPIMVSVFISYVEQGKLQSFATVWLLDWVFWKLCFDVGFIHGANWRKIVCLLHDRLSLNHRLLLIYKWGTWPWTCPIHMDQTIIFSGKPVWYRKQPLSVADPRGVNRVHFEPVFVKQLFLLWELCIHPPFTPTPTPLNTPWQV